MSPPATPDWKSKLKTLGLSRKRSAKPGAPGKSAAHVASGRDGEERAADYLARRGVVVLARNVRYEDGELDLVAEAEETVIFVEVKRRRDASRGTAEEAVTPRKRARVVRAARRWLREHPASASREVRFDVIAIQDAPARIEWFPGAFDAR